jgi:hypothetical protein
MPVEVVDETWMGPKRRRSLASRGRRQADVATWRKVINGGAVTHDTIAALSPDFVLDVVRDDVPDILSIRALDLMIVDERGVDAEHANQSRAEFRVGDILDLPPKMLAHAWVFVVEPAAWLAWYAAMTN